MNTNMDNYEYNDWEEVEEECRLYRKKQSYYKQLKMWLSEKLERYCVRYIGDESVHKITHSKWENFKFKVASRLEFKLRK